MVARNNDQRLPPGTRMHIVLIPGFAGFDALGQLEYYAGVTPLFRAWQKQRTEVTAVLHYFDNFPTAGVVTRAARLHGYLAKRIARGEISGGDRIALVGHSTGGLDIRRLLWELETISGPVLVDGGKDERCAIEPGEILARIKRVVFLSVPQWGTNIADWVRAHAPERKIVVAELRGAVTASQVPLLDTLQRLVSGEISSFADTDLFYAIQDSLREAEADTPRDKRGTADAQEAAALLGLWLRHMCTDFSAIDDLTAQIPDGPYASPAHFNLEDRKRERRIWNDYRIHLRSYATLGNNPFRFGKDCVPRWELLRPCTYPEFGKDEKRATGTDIVYRTCYRACAGGPFDYPPDPVAHVATDFENGLRQSITVWDNDGIVNTASMLWPNGEDTLLVPGDHMDIVGHYQRVPADEGSDRKFQAYDLLKSKSAFSPAIFDKVWKGVFDFCVGIKAGQARAATGKR